MTDDSSASTESSASTFYLIYDADQTIRGELSYFVGHALGKVNCALCDISHGPIRQKQEWKAWLADVHRRGHDLRPIHRDEMDDRLRDFVGGRLACVVQERNDGYSLLLGPTELAGCNGQVRALVQLLEPWLTR